MKKIAKKLKLITHSGTFHSDDIFACATLCLVLENSNEEFEIIRTRDEEIIHTGDYVFDIGGVYEPESNRFDHHQCGGAGKRENGIEYASFGLVWKQFGARLSGSERAAEIIEKKLVVPVDADDNGIYLFEKKYESSPFLIQDYFKLFRPTWKEDPNIDEKYFLKAVEIAKEIISRSIVHANAEIEAEQAIMDAYNNSADKRIVTLDRYYPPGSIFDSLKDVLFIVFPRDNVNLWATKAVKNHGEDFKNRKDLPSAWAGLSDEKLAKISGVPDAVFCHRNLFVANAKSKEGAIKLAQIAVES